MEMHISPEENYDNWLEYNSFNSTIKIYNLGKLTI